jgi:DNA invertase Pin-like site-specific DNA recombinase
MEKKELARDRAARQSYDPGLRSGMRRARLEGQHIGRHLLELDHAAIRRDRCQGQSIRQIAKGHRISTATVQRVLRKPPVPEQVAEALEKSA